jgi:hypothetical protein
LDVVLILILLSYVVVFVIFCATLMATDQVNDTYNPTIDPTRKAKSKDPGWAYGYWANIQIMSHAFFVKLWCVEG